MTVKINIDVHTNPWHYAWQAGVHPYIGLTNPSALIVVFGLIPSGYKSKPFG